MGSNSFFNSSTSKNISTTQNKESEMAHVLFSNNSSSSDDSNDDQGSPIEQQRPLNDLDRMFLQNSDLKRHVSTELGGLGVAVSRCRYDIGVLDNDISLLRGETRDVSMLSKDCLKYIRVLLFICCVQTMLIGIGVSAAVYYVQNKTSSNYSDDNKKNTAVTLEVTGDE